MKPASHLSSEKPKAPHGKIKLIIEYDGTDFQGWQRQEPHVPTIQRTMEDALQEIFKVHVTLIGAGRTDSGVHAENQVAHFIAPREVGTFKFIPLFNSLLPKSICVKDASRMEADFHAQHSAKSKTYVYRIWNSPVSSALRARYSLWVRKPLDLEKLNGACQDLLGTHDFNCFRSEGSAIKTTIRTIFSAGFFIRGDYVEFEINGNGFMKQMVRNIVGTFLQMEIGTRSEKSLKELIRLCDRKKAGPAVPPQGLYLSKVYY